MKKLLYALIPFACFAGQEDFEQTSRIMAFPAVEMAQLSEHRNSYGAELPTSGRPNAPVVVTLLGHQDGMSGILRAGMMPLTVTATPLTDGRYAVAGCWSLALKVAWEAGDVQAEELSPSEFKALLPEATE